MGMEKVFYMWQVATYCVIYIRIRKKVMRKKILCLIFALIGSVH